MDTAPQGDHASSLPPAHLRHDQIEQLRTLGTEQPVEQGAILFAAGDPSYNLFVVLEGTAEILDRAPAVGERLVASYGPGEFLGELGMLIGEPPALTGRMASSGLVLNVPADRVSALMADEPELSELILRVFLSRRAALLRRGMGVTLVGSRFDERTHSLMEFFARNRIAVRWLDLEAHADAEALLAELDVPTSELPIVVVPGRPLLRNPTHGQVASVFGPGVMANVPERGVCDLLVVGGGPAGLAAAVYGASEGLDTTLLDATGFGGQAGTSSRIENYLGFPAGLSGSELAARSVIQAEKFGVRLRSNVRATALRLEAGLHEVICDDGTTIAARSLIIATGASYRRIQIADLERWEGSGVYYAATLAEARYCDDRPVVVVGGANSAGQAALFLARNTKHVHVLVRGTDLEHSMSRYLIDAIRAQPKITVHLRTQAVGILGDDSITGLEVVDAETGRTSRIDACAVFVFVGAQPCTQWLDGQLATDDKGFLLTGRELGGFPDREREPFIFETSRPGTFCVGDVRSGSVKRVATAVGEGSAAVRIVFEQLRADQVGVV